MERAALACAWGPLGCEAWYGLSTATYHLAQSGSAPNLELHEASVAHAQHGLKLPQAGVFRAPRDVADAELARTLNHSLFLLGRWEEAAEVVRGALKILPDDSLLLMNDAFARSMEAEANRAATMLSWNLTKPPLVGRLET